MNGLKLVATVPVAVTLTGDTAAAVAIPTVWQHRSFVLVTSVSGAVGGVNADV